MKNSLGQFVSKRRKQLYLTQEELAKRMQVSKSAVAKWETDGGVPDRDNLYKLANVLKVTADDLYQLISQNKIQGNRRKKETMPDMTSEIVDLLEARGYRVIRPSDESNLSRRDEKKEEEYYEKKRSK